MGSEGVVVPGWLEVARVEVHADAEGCWDGFYRSWVLGIG